MRFRRYGILLAVLLVSLLLLTVQTRGGGTNAGFLAALYQDALGRPIDPAGLATWTTILVNGVPGFPPVQPARTFVVTQILNSTEYNVRLVQTNYVKFLFRPADTAGLQSWVNFLAGGGTEEQLIINLVASQEYFQFRHTKV